MNDATSSAAGDNWRSRRVLSQHASSRSMHQVAEHGSRMRRATPRSGAPPTHATSVAAPEARAPPSSAPSLSRLSETAPSSSAASALRMLSRASPPLPHLPHLTLAPIAVTPCHRPHPRRPAIFALLTSTWPPSPSGLEAANSRWRDRARLAHALAAVQRGASTLSPNALPARRRTCPDDGTAGRYRRCCAGRGAVAVNGAPSDAPSDARRRRRAERSHKSTTSSWPALPASLGLATPPLRITRRIQATSAQRLMERMQARSARLRTEAHMPTRGMALAAAWALRRVARIPRAGRQALLTSSQPARRRAVNAAASVGASDAPPHH